MSASLVGSEMCIRDRLLEDLHLDVVVKRRQVRGADGRAVGVASDVGPVSYTHLTLPTICSV
eukprot:10836787-Alexandrium_andersonii.AAC.1